MRTLAIALCWLWLGTAHAETRINAVIGDASGPAAADEATRITTHLTYVLARLQAVPSVRPDRRAVLAALARYIERGEYPRRTGDRYAGRRPWFVDDRGVYCAVGQLLVDSGAEALARSLAAEHPYGYLLDIDSPALAAWARGHGMTLAELAMIQPTYHEPMPDPEVIRSTVAGRADAFAIACARRSPPLAKVALHITSNDHAKLDASTTTPGPFARCVAETVSTLAFRSSHRIAPFAFDLALVLKDPDALFEAQLDTLRVDRDCAIGPGELARWATIDATSNANVFDLKVTTEPANEEITACIAKDARARMAAFDVGIWDLHGTRYLEIPRVVSPDKLKGSLALAVPSYAARCSPEAPKHVRVTVSAKVDAPRFTIAVEDGTTEFRICVRDLLQTYLRTAYAVRGYFRIDADVQATYP